ncbi:MAG: UPF0158 family protein [Candidatus Cyclonatronum sp.]|uniref:UPF0158 family protein n=1 Tax=Cyclonatronum sp. TaxID=3024185 RepID=UPI0025B99BFD|nr:UPF0158 family protein [Cyclonatronum sp.]MCH8486914.1 UPF0158 family protein [Cyclonatronum sp.]
MKFPDEETIRQITETLNDGIMCVYIHKETGELLLIPTQENMDYMGSDFMEEERKELEENEEQYAEISGWETWEAFEYMKVFAEDLSSHPELQEQLLEALSRSKPFRNFKDVLFEDEEVRQQWFDFESKWQQAHVRKRLEFIFD